MQDFHTLKYERFQSNKVQPIKITFLYSAAVCTCTIRYQGWQKLVFLVFSFFGFLKKPEKPKKSNFGFFGFLKIKFLKIKFFKK